MNPLLTATTRTWTRLRRPFGQAAGKPSRKLSSDWLWVALHRQIDDHILHEAQEEDERVLTLFCWFSLFNSKTFAGLSP